MGAFLTFTDRNLKLYFRDKASVFFSLFSMIITIVLMIFFLENINIEGVMDLLNQFSKHSYAQNKENARALIYFWTSAGILSMNTVTVTLAIYSTMIKDRTSGKLNAIYTAPISRTILTVSYIATAWSASILVCIFTFVVIEIYGMMQGFTIYSITEHIYMIGVICVNSFFYATIMYLLALIAKSEGAWSGIGTIVGTLVGFLGATYIPISTLSSSMENVLKGTPILYSTALFRKIMLEDILQETFYGVPKEVRVQYREAMGIDITIFSHSVRVSEISIALFFTGMIFMGVAIFALKHRKKVDR